MQFSNQLSLPTYTSCGTAEYKTNRHLNTFWKTCQVFSVKFKHRPEPRKDEFVEERANNGWNVLEKAVGLTPKIKHQKLLQSKWNKEERKWALQAVSPPQEHISSRGAESPQPSWSTWKLQDAGTSQNPKSERNFPNGDCVVLGKRTLGSPNCSFSG